jgi:hypothetical protein
MRRFVLLLSLTAFLVLAASGCRSAVTSGPTPAQPTPTHAPASPTPLPPTPTLTPPTPTTTPIPARSYPAAIRADFEASPRTWMSKTGFLRDIGVNTIIIHLAFLRDSGEEYELVYPYPSDGPTSEEYVRQLVMVAREEGFAVILGPLVGRVGDPHVPIEQIDDWNRFKADSVEIVVRWAVIAEELQVEYYMPFCELNAVLFSQEDPDRPGEPRYTFDEVMALLAEWDGEALPRIRAVFSGQLISQIYPTYAGSLLQYPVTGYDIFGIAFYAGSPGVEGVTTEFRSVLEDAQTLARREGVDWMVVEMEVAPLRASDPNAPFEAPEWISDADAGPLDVEAALWSMATEEYLNATEPAPAGFGTSLDTTAEGYRSVEGTPTEQVLREFFAALEQPR